MATSKDYIEFVCDQLHGFESVLYKKMFGEYMVYIDGKPILLVCDNNVFVKKLPELEQILKDSRCGYPYEGAKEHYLIDIDDADLVSEVAKILLPITSIPKLKGKAAVFGK